MQTVPGKGFEGSFDYESLKRTSHRFSRAFRDKIITTLKISIKP